MRGEQSNDDLSFLAGGGEMGERARGTGLVKHAGGLSRALAAEPQDGCEHLPQFALSDRRVVGPSRLHDVLQ